MEKLVSTALAVGMVLTCGVMSALAGEPDSVQEFRQGKPEMLFWVLLICGLSKMMARSGGAVWFASKMKKVAMTIDTSAGYTAE